MFTNWLTGTSGSSVSSSSGANRTHEPSQTSNGLSLVGVNGLTNLNPNIISTPPDIVLEVGPAPPTIRFMAHSIVLGMHSGYLRSAIRLDERNGSSVSGVHQQLGADFIVFLSNVTAEQFAPLLSYMYTGYLDLNVENIFGVLLATHVLHMPRALEICRSYLARAQAEGYFGSNSSSISNPLSNAISSTSNHQSNLHSSKIIRPIASKPQLNNFGFLSLPHPMNSLTPIVNRTSTIPPTATTVGKIINHELSSEKDEDDDIDVDESASNEIILPTTNGTAVVTADNDEDDEDIEVFIDTTSDAEVVVESEIKKLSFKKILENKHKNKDLDSSVPSHSKSRHEKAHKKHHRSDKRRKSGTGPSSSSGLQVAKAPIPASQLDTSEANKVIIDVASCDGPVRFKRILNTAYGHKPDNCSSANYQRTGVAVAGQERSLQSVSLSFHQQMAKAISQQQQLHNAEESENSETSNCSAGGGGGNGTGSSKTGRKIQNEIFVCVYCKHTFKSQYCYQKHAKRHLNPLTLQATCVPPTEKRQIGEESAKATSATITESQTSQLKGLNLQNARPFLVRNPASATGHQTANQGCNALSTQADFLRREVRPLDMNVQYYPCKTCGCKFPSYYFVHKHRKMCHADEEASQQTTTNIAIGTSTGSATSTASTAIEESTIVQNDNTVEISVDNTKNI